MSWLHAIISVLTFSVMSESEGVKWSPRCSWRRLPSSLSLATMVLNNCLTRIFLFDGELWFVNAGSARLFRDDSLVDFAQGRWEHIQGLVVGNGHGNSELNFNTILKLFALLAITILC